MNCVTCTWVWENRTKVIGYTGAAIAQLGVSGLVGQKTALWCAFVASAITLAIGHFNSRPKETP